MGLDANKLELLLVEDQPILRTTIAMILGATGFAVTSAASASEATQLIRGKRFDLLVSDLNLETTHDGLQVIQEMQRAQPGVITCIWTATPDAKSLLWSMRNHVDGYFEKTVDMPRLAGLLMEYAQGRRSIQRVAA